MTKKENEIEWGKGTMTVNNGQVLIKRGGLWQRKIYKNWRNMIILYLF
jgi:hypothetical protein